MEEKEIYLRDYLRILWKRKWAVILVPIISVITTAVMVFGFQKTHSQPQVYEGVVVIQNGSIVNPIFEKAEAFEKVRLIANKTNKSVQFEDISNTLYFKIIINGASLNSVEEASMEIAREYVKNSNILYEKKYQIYVEELELIKQKKHMIKRGIKRLHECYLNSIKILQQKKQILKSNVTQLNESADKLSKTEGIEGFEVFNGRMNCENRIADNKIRVLDIETEMLVKKLEYQTYIKDINISMLQEEKSILNVNLILVDAKKFVIAEAVTVTDITPTEFRFNKKAKLLISAILGLIGGVILAFAIENWRLPKTII